MLPISVWACLFLVWGHFLLYIVSDLCTWPRIPFSHQCLYLPIFKYLAFCWFPDFSILEVFCGFKSFHLLCLFYLDSLLYLLSQYSIFCLTHFICKTCPEFSEILSFSISFSFYCEFSSMFFLKSLYWIQLSILTNHHFILLYICTFLDIAEALINISFSSVKSLLMFSLSSLSYLIKIYDCSFKLYVLGFI